MIISRSLAAPPIGFRVGINRTWDSRWYADKDNYSDLLHEDLELRRFLHRRLRQAGISKVVIERPAKRARVTIHTARPGVVIGKKGETIVNGGLSGVEGIVGLGNNFKSTIMHYLMLTAADRVEASLPEVTFMHTYDTEDNMVYDIERYNHLANVATNYLPKDPIDVGVWSITSKATQDADKWVKTFLYPTVDEIVKDEKTYKTVYEAFYNKAEGKPLELEVPTFIEIDSLTEFEPDLVIVYSGGNDANNRYGI